MDLESILGSKGKIKILKILLRQGQANISLLVRETGLHHRLVVKHLEDLKAANIVSEKKFGRVRLFEVDLTDPRVSALKELIDELEKL